MAKDVQRFREAERRLWESVGVEPTARMVRLRSGETVRVQEAGTGPAVLFVHGASNGGSSWASLIASLEEFRCIALDRPGCGLSDPVAGPAGNGDVEAAEHFADSLVCNVLDALELASAHLVATSYGGLFAFRGAAAHPQRVGRIVEFSWSMGAPMAKIPMSMRMGALPGVSRLMGSVPPTRGSVRMLLRQIGLAGALDSGRFDDTMFEWFYAVLRHTETMRNELRAMPPLVTPIRGIRTRALLTREQLAPIASPVRFLWGEDDPNGGEEIARAFAALFPDATVEMIPAAGHAPWIDEPDLSAERTRAFLRS